MKKLIVSFMVLILTGCGANVHRSTGLENEQHIIIIAKSLVGKTISVGNISNHLISSRDLTPFETGIAGVTDSKMEQSDILKVKVSEGMNKIIITDNGKAVLSKEVYLSAGQTRTIEL